MSPVVNPFSTLMYIISTVKTFMTKKKYKTTEKWPINKNIRVEL